MKNLTLSTILLVSVLVLSGCGQKEVQNPQPVQQQQTVNPVNTASTQLVENMKFALNKNWEIVDTNKIYVTKSKDFENAYFIGTLVKNGSQIYNCIWFSNSETMNGDTMSANDYAIQASSIVDGRKSQAAISQSDDGYSRINQKLLVDMNNIIN